MQKNEPLAQRVDQATSQERILVQDQLNNTPRCIRAEKVANMKDIAHHAHDAVILQLRNGQPAARPHNHIVSQGAEQHQHLLRFKTFFAASRHAQSLLVAFERRFNTSPALIVESQIGHQNGQWINHERDGLLGQLQYIASREGREQNASGPLSVRLARTHGKAANRRT